MRSVVRSFYKGVLLKCCYHGSIYTDVLFGSCYYGIVSKGENCLDCCFLFFFLLPTIVFNVVLTIKGTFLDTALV